MEADQEREGWLWVMAQGVLLALWTSMLLFGLPWTTSALVQYVVQGIGVLITAVGCVLAVAAVSQLGRHLTPVPRPHPNAPLVTTGVYERARHPIYGGIILVVVGLTLTFMAPLAVIPALLVLVFFAVKARHEEGLLCSRFPEYESYAAGRKRFVPWIW